jgi:hypothetical protein
MTANRASRGGIVVITALALGALAAPSVGAAGGRPPKVIQLSYAESYDGGTQARTLEAFAYRADSLALSTSYGDASAKTDARYNDSVTDTDLHGNDAKHPWVARRNRRGGKEVLHLVRTSLEARGFAEVSAIAKSEGGVDRVGFTIRVSDCSQDPPIYPLDCEVARSGGD